jgi:DNA-binding NarL/FixJ family response regulator
MSEPKPVRVLIAGEKNSFRAELSQLMEHNSRIKVIGYTDSADEAVTLALAQHPDLVLMDMAIHGTNGLAATRALKERRPTIPVILFSILREQDYLGIARYSGVDRCLNKRDVDEKLLPLIESLMAPPPAR